MDLPASSRPAARRRTSRAVRVADRVSRVLITGGGIGTIVAVVAILVFLVWVVVPLFAPAEIGPGTVVRPDPGAGSARGPGDTVLDGGVDEYRLLAWDIRRDGSMRSFRLDGGEGGRLRELGVVRPFGDLAPSALAIDVETGNAVFGFEDGSLRLGRLGFAARFLPVGSLPPDLLALAVGEAVPHDGGIAQRTPEGQIRVQTLAVAVDEPVAGDGTRPVRALDVASGTAGTALAALDGDGAVRVYRLTTRTDLRTGRTTIKVLPGRVPFERPPGRGVPDRLLLSAAADVLYVVWAEGLLQRYFRHPTLHWVLAETVDLVEESGATVTALAPLVGRSSLAVGDSTGRLRIWFRSRPEQGTDVESADGFRMVVGHEFADAASPVTALGPSARSRLLAVGRADGTVEVLQVTSQRRLGSVRTATGGVLGVSLAPREDALVARTAEAIETWSLDARAPEVTLAALFRPVWYEGHPGPQHVWQSTGGTNDFEPKLGLLPLIFGTLKAAFYSLLLGVPLALLAALFTSEFLSPRLRVPVKSVIEVMAGLPSVVLGFLAALVIAPFVQPAVPSLLLAFLMVPAAFLGAAYLWQTLPPGLTLRLGSLGRLAGLVLALAAGLGLASVLGGPVERLLFWVGAGGERRGDFRAWLDDPSLGSATGGWVLLLLPVVSLFALFAMGRWVRPALRRVTVDWSRGACALADLVRFTLGAVLALALTVALAALLDALGLDARGSVLGTYVQRNALIVGFVMGFAIIPIVYTLAEDALSGIPGHLREGSLGAGATTWQTALRIVVPTAMSGLFSAVMIGLGRAVGETMIVLMAAGNTPILDVNPFNGFRTLSANIAVEMPEAVRGDTHYRVLFLTAVVLFAMTFVVNTVAEVVRQRFRRRASHL